MADKLTYEDWCTWRDEHYGDDGIIALEYTVEMPEEFEDFFSLDLAKGIIRFAPDN